MPDWLGLNALAEKERARRAEARMAADGIPPLDVAPQVTPVSAVKNQVALQNQLTPEAADTLYTTPTHITFAPYQEGDDTSGSYTSSTLPNDRLRDLFNEPTGSGNIAITNYDPALPPLEGIRKTMMHELAHKWDFEKVPDARRSEWQNEWPQLAPPWITQFVAVRPDTQNDITQAGYEAYAHLAEGGPYGMPPEVRGYYYPGLFQSGLGELPPPPQLVWNPPILSARR